MANENPEADVYRLKRSFKIAVSFTVVLWLIKIIESAVGASLGQYGVYPGQLSGLVGSASGHRNAREPLDTIYMAALVNRAVVSREQDDGEFGQWVQRLKQSMNATQSPGTAFKGRLLRFEAELHRRGGNFENADACFEQALLSSPWRSISRSLQCNIIEARLHG